MTLRGPFHPLLFCDSVILWKHRLHSRHSGFTPDRLRSVSDTILWVAKTVSTAQDTPLVVISGRKPQQSTTSDSWPFVLNIWMGHQNTMVTTHFVSTFPECHVTSWQGDKRSTSLCLVIATSREGLFKVSSFPVPPRWSSRSTDRQKKGSSGVSGPPPWGTVPLHRCHSALGVCSVSW